MARFIITIIGPSKPRGLAFIGFQRSKSLPQKTSLQMVDITTGKTVWTTGEMMGANMGAYPIASHGMVLFVSGLSMHEKGAAIYLQAYGIEKGNLLWESKYADFNALKQHMADNSSNWFVKFSEAPLNNGS